VGIIDQPFALGKKSKEISAEEKTFSLAIEGDCA